MKKEYKEHYIKQFGPQALVDLLQALYKEKEEDLDEQEFVGMYKSVEHYKRAISRRIKLVEEVLCEQGYRVIREIKTNKVWIDNGPKIKLK